MKCRMCEGLLEDSVSTYMVNLKNCIIIVKNVPSQVCDQCGEVSFSFTITKKLDELVRELKKRDGVI